MRSILFTVLLSLTLFLNGCATAPVERVVIKTETHLIKTPESLLKLCEVKAPPLKEEYVKLNYKQKESVLTNYSIDLLNALAVCNLRISSISEFQSKEEKNLLEAKGGK